MRLQPGQVSDLGAAGVAATRPFPHARSKGESEKRELFMALAAMRGRLALVALLLALAGAAWWLSAVRMGGMAMGRSGMTAMHGQGMMTTSTGTYLGTLGWFVVTWVVMMAAMMFPSLAPTVALYARITRRRGLDRALLFAAGYLLVWGAAGVIAYGLFEAGRALLHHELAWSRAGSTVAAGVVVLAAVYQFTPWKDACLGKCRGPLGFILSAWREGRRGALQMGAHNALWCLGCCWALMAALFALGVMSLAWMAVVAALIALEKTLPWRRLATGGTSFALLGLAGALLAGLAS